VAQYPHPKFEEEPMDFSIKRDVFHKVSIQLKEDHIDFMSKFKMLLEESNPGVDAISENEVYQKAFDFLMSDKRITQKINAAVKKKKGTIADLTLKQKNA
jgi:hypothetical protein